MALLLSFAAEAFDLLEDVCGFSSYNTDNGCFYSPDKRLLPDAESKNESVGIRVALGQ